VISDSAIRRALKRIALLKFFPSGNAEALATVAEMLGELYSSDGDVERAVSNLLHDAEMAEWPGPGVFFEQLKCVVYPRGMWRVGGRWVPHPANGREFDIIHPDGSRHWVNGAYYQSPMKPWPEEAA
jgi:hypothetical protein